MYGSVNKQVESTRNDSVTGYSRRNIVGFMLFGVVLLCVVLAGYTPKVEKSIPMSVNVSLKLSANEYFMAMSLKNKLGTKTPFVERLNQLKGDQTYIVKHNQFNAVMTRQAQVDLQTISTKMKINGNENAFIVNPFQSSLVERCSRTLNFSAPLIDLDHLQPTTTNLAGKIGIFHIRNANANCRAISFASTHNMAMLLFHGNTSELSICPSYEYEIDLHPGYAGTLYAPRLSVVAAEKRQQLHFPVARLSNEAARVISRESISNSREILVDIERECEHGINKEWQVDMAMSGITDQDQWIALEAEHLADVTALGSIIHSFQSLSNSGWTPIRPIAFTASTGSLLRQKDGIDAFVRFRLTEALPRSTKLPLHTVYLRLLWLDLECNSPAPAIYSSPSYHNPKTLYVGGGDTTDRILLWSILGIHATTGNLIDKLNVPQLRQLVAIDENTIKSTDCAATINSANQIIDGLTEESPTRYSSILALDYDLGRMSQHCPELSNLSTSLNTVGSQLFSIN